MIVQNNKGIAGRQRILLVDDDMKYCRLISSYLTRHGYDVNAVYDGDSALQIVSDGSWQAVILDVIVRD